MNVKSIAFETLFLLLLLCKLHFITSVSFKKNEKCISVWWETATCCEKVRLHNLRVLTTKSISHSLHQKENNSSNRKMMLHLNCCLLKKYLSNGSSLLRSLQCSPGQKLPFYSTKRQHEREAAYVPNSKHFLHKKAVKFLLYPKRAE